MHLGYVEAQRYTMLYPISPVFVFVSSLFIVQRVLCGFAFVSFCFVLFLSSHLVFSVSGYLHVALLVSSIHYVGELGRPLASARGRATDFSA